MTRRTGNALAVFCLCVFVPLTLPAAEPALVEGFSMPKLEALGAQLKRDADAGKLPGSVLLVMRNGKLVYAQVSGEQNPKTHAAMQRDAIFRLFSITKPVVSVAVMKMVEEGRLMMNDPVARYLPELRELKVGVEKTDAVGTPTLERVAAVRPVTVQDLLRHTSGFTYSYPGRSPYREEYRKAGIESRDQDCGEFLKRLAGVPLVAQPATTWEYGVSTDVLGCLLEKLSGQNLAEHLQQHVLAPLGMNDTGFVVPKEKHERIAEAFETDPDSKAPTNLPDPRVPPKFLSGGAGLLSTADDYMKFAEMMLNGGQGKEARILSPKTVEYMLADHLVSLRAAAPASPVLGPRPGYSFGLGFAVRTDLGGAGNPGSVGMADWTGAGGTGFWIDPKEKLAVVWMTQAPARFAYTRQLILNRVYAALEKPAEK